MEEIMPTSDEWRKLQEEITNLRSVGQSLEKQKETDSTQIYNLRCDVANLERLLTRAKLTARINNFLFEKLREEFVEEVSYHQTRNNQLIKERDHYRGLVENANNPQKTSD